MSSLHLVGIFLDNGQVCTYYNFDAKGKHYESGDLVDLPRGDKPDCAVVILGIHEDMRQSTRAAADYFNRICKWDGVTDRSAVKIFGHDLIKIEEEVSQIALFYTQGVDGPLLLSSNCFDLICSDNDTSEQDSQEQD
ncbi:uncharacterized protein LOC117650787 [Thrips palmi]|uniref:Uncharacterized protein LOC117650787 n=1 Tax=Thrips palmi TaxID=161013 RepID=A0A6P9A020_THRPL|nr:uncharacterized protein LOC117650787 [Thrips palmi]